MLLSVIIVSRKQYIEGVGILPKERCEAAMLKLLRRWHWNLLHNVFGLADRDHTTPLAHHSMAPAHHRHANRLPSQSAQAQFEREMRREPTVLRNWQLSIRRFVTRRRAESDQRSES